ncbi:PVC-type heme-binding CxxCH protein [Lacihabitans soyangensis]|uniref:PVC-type heme-binding CxxCH protein n=1 Tax=Lacihabitans soyangensis TaxID=869394 RepID=UPI0020CBE8F0|nr:PVC-type heme-binding CxxCH protein [Lacihabitans soyangensis]
MIAFIILGLFSCNKNQKTPDGFEIQDGFKLELVASEPLIKDPVDLEFNEKGDAMVLEMPGYPMEDKQSRILILKDKNKDGVYDSTIVFMDNLGLADSFMPYKKGVLVAAPPYLLQLHDDNGDYIVEKIDTLMGGFAKENLQHNYNGLTYGIDNWIYAANGGNDGKPYWWGDTTTAMDLRGQDLRFNLETRQMERLGESSGGFGLAMDEYGRFFETHNLTHISHLVFPDRYLKGRQILPENTLQNISDHEENGLARIFPIGEQEDRVNHPEQSGYFSGSCGVTYYGGGAFGDKYKNTVWVADVVLNLIHVDKIKPNGASFTASRIFENKDFLASSDRAFRPVNMSVGPDGSMYVIDIHRKVIEHPEWIPDEIEKTLDLNAGKNQGRIYKISLENESFDFKQFSSSEGLVQSLKNPNQWVRNTAQRLLMENVLSNETFLGLKKLLESDNELARLHAIWILSYSGKLTPNEVAAALKDKNAANRENVLKIAENYLPESESILDKIIGLLNDPDARVRMQAALSLSMLPENHPFYKKNQDLILESLAKTAKLPNDEWNIAAITLAAQTKTVELFARISQEKNVNASLLASLALNISGETDDVLSILNHLSTSPISDKEKTLVVSQLAKQTEKVNGKSIENQISQLEHKAGLNFLTSLASLRQKLKLQPSSQFLKYSKSASKNVLDASLPDSVRVQYLSLLDFLPYAQKSTILFECLKNNQPLKLQENALRQLSNYREKEIGHKVVAMWKALSPQTRRYASDLLLYIESNHDALLTGLEKGIINIGEMNFDLERRRTLLWWTDNENTKSRAKRLFSDSGVSNRQAAMDKMKPALTLKGNNLNGEKVFSNTCATCHKYGSIGKEVGPVLTEISRKSKATMLHDILDPNAAVDPKYVNHSLETKSGAIHMGIVANETDKSVTIHKIGGEKVLINKSDIKKFRSMGTSLMMEGFENALSNQEMADLLEFLQKGGKK